MLDHVIDHLPVFGTFLGLGLLGLSLFRPKSHLARAGLVMIVLSAIGAHFLPGGTAHVVEHVAGVGDEISPERAGRLVERAEHARERVIDRYDESGRAAVVILEVAGAIALLSLLLGALGKARRSLVAAVVVLALAAAVLMGYAALVGDRARRREGRDGSISTTISSTGHGD